MRRDVSLLGISRGEVPKSGNLPEQQEHGRDRGVKVVPGLREQHRKLGVLAVMVIGLGMAALRSPATWWDIIV